MKILDEEVGCANALINRVEDKSELKLQSFLRNMVITVRNYIPQYAIAAQKLFSEHFSEPIQLLWSISNRFRAAVMNR